MNLNVDALIQGSLDTAAAAKAVQSSKGLVNSKAKDIDQAAKDFEAVFISQMLRPMFETIPENEVFGGGRAEEMWRDVMIEEYGKIMSERGGLGIADSVKAELIKFQEIQE